MKHVLFLIFLFAIISCKQNKQANFLLTEDLKYTACNWHIGLDSNEFYLVSYLDIDKNGHYLLMQHISFVDTPNYKYFKGEISDTIRKQINATLSDTTFESNYYYKNPNSVLYCGPDYCIDFRNKSGIRKTIQFIPSQSPSKIQALVSLLDKLIDSAHFNKRCDSFSISGYYDTLKKWHSTNLPIRVPPNIEIIHQKN